jgi:hypothetical protein
MLCNDVCGLNVMMYVDVYNDVCIGYVMMYVDVM